MMSLRRSLFPVALALGLFLSSALPAAAASYYYPQNPPTYYPPYNQPSNQTLWVYVYVSGGSRSPSDFTIQVNGNNPAPSSFVGSSAGRAVSIQQGNYSVSVRDLHGYTPSYSGCNGYIGYGGSQTCTITLTTSGGYYPPYPPTYPPSCPPYQHGCTTYPPQNCNISTHGCHGPSTCCPTCCQTPVYQPPVYTPPPPTIYVKGYVPSFPSTGFAPISGEMLVYAGILLLGVGIFLYPYVRKTLAFAFR